MNRQLVQVLLVLTACVLAKEALAAAAPLERNVWAGQAAVEQDTPRIKAGAKLYKLLPGDKLSEEGKKLLKNAKDELVQNGAKGIFRYIIVRGVLKDDSIAVQELVVMKGSSPTDGWPFPKQRTDEDQKQWRAHQNAEKEKKTK